MSVIKSRRNESKMEFLYTARELELYTIQRCAHFPKKYNFYLGQPIAQMAFQIYHCVKCANSIYPLNQHEVQMRRDYFLKANATLNSMVSQIEVAAELFGMNSDQLEHWAGLVGKEIRLIKGVIKEDRNRYKNL